MRAGLFSALLAIPALGAPSHGPNALHDGTEQRQAIFPAPAPAGSTSSSTTTSFSEGVNGTMARYMFEDEHDAAEFAAWAEDAGKDVWHVTPSYADLFVPQEQTVPEGAQLTWPLSFPSPPSSPASDSFALPKLTHLNSTYHASYRRIPDISSFLNALEKQAPEFVSRRTYGHSYEGRPLEVVHVRNQSAVTQGAVVVLGTMHGREWIATAATSYLLHALVTPEDEPGSLRSLLEHHDFYVIPTPNPDGYEYTWTNDRLWYKNRQTVSSSGSCVGIDLARNWGYKWKRSATSPGFSSTTDSDSDEVEDEEETFTTRPRGPPVNPCSSGYPGTRSFEAPETSALDVFLRSLPASFPGGSSHGVSAFVELRAYGQLVSVPFAHSCKRTPKDAEDQLELASGAAHVAMKAHGASYSVGRLCSQFYKANGNILDYMYARAGVKYAYTIRLRDTGTYGFMLPPNMIRPVGEETAEMITYLTKFMRDRLA